MCKELVKYNSILLIYLFSIIARYRFRSTWREKLELSIIGGYRGGGVHPFFKKLIFAMFNDATLYESNGWQTYSHERLHPFHKILDPLLSILLFCDIAWLRVRCDLHVKHSNEFYTFTLFLYKQSYHVKYAFNFHLISNITFDGDMFIIFSWREKLDISFRRPCRARFRIPLRQTIYFQSWCIFHYLPVPHSSSKPVQMKSSMKSNQSNRCMERKIIWLNMAA